MLFGLLGLVAAQSAQAFYNPSTGRWSSRDPIGELGHELLRLSASGINYNSVGIAHRNYTIRKRINHQRTSSDDAGYQFVLNNPVLFVDPDGRDIYTMKGNDARSCCGSVPNCVNNSIHISVCVDTWDGAGEGTEPTGRECFSFGATGVGVYGPKTTWFGWSSWTFTCLGGEIYRETFKDGTILRRHKTTPQQDKAWLNYMTTKRVGTKDGYSVARQNCRKYSNMEFDDAPKHYGP